MWVGVPPDIREAIAEHLPKDIREGALLLGVFGVLDELLHSEMHVSYDAYPSMSTLPTSAWKIVESASDDGNWYAGIVCCTLFGWVIGIALDVSKDRAKRSAKAAQPTIAGVH